MKKGIILARVSTPEQEKTGLSIKDIQLPKLRQYALDNNIQVEPEHEFVFQETAKRAFRKKFNEVVSLVKKTPELEAVIGFRVDRVTRNFRDAVAMDDLRNEYGKELHFVDDRLVLTSKSFGRDIQDWDMKVFLAKQHINRCQEDANNTLMAKLNAGEQYGKAPYGYKNVEMPNGKRGAELVPFDAQVVKKIYEWYLSGTSSMETVRQRLQRDLGVKMHKSKVEKILDNPYYYGVQRSRGKLYPHIYPTLVTEDEYNQVQDIRSGRVKRKVKYVGKPYAYRGLIKCKECGCAITPEYHRKKQKNGNVHDYVYYHCTESKGKHGASWVEEAELEKQFAQIYKQMHISEEDLKWMTDQLKDAHEGKKQFNTKQFDHYNAQLKTLQTKIENLYEDKLAGSITQEVYDKYHSKFRAQQTEYRAKLDRLQAADEDYYITASYLLELASRSYDLFIGSEIDQKREIIQLTLLNLSLDNGKLNYQMQKPFDSIFAAKDRPLMGEQRGSNP